ncbi:Hypothetical protein, putative [Bodo saltans]|uniref:Ubiquitin-like domain-containing protein n=1 Tax=Bodo saltans TaxID=75058 RepID=A0A0S4IST6_BODSA|nr:Hypothetical protein, putative [Bodo saltans]|eukprot:CUF65081.1 Hypothetical protein, putative [Bodo saltans]
MRRLLVAEFGAACGVSQRCITADSLERYRQDSFEASERLRASQTYPGAIRAATPGDTKYYFGRESILPQGQRHYWRAVVDDPQVEQTVTLRIRLKDNVWVTSGWETRLHVVQVVVPLDATVAEVIDQVLVDNQSPYLCTSPIALAVDGRDIAGDRTVKELGLHEHSIIDGYDVKGDHLSHMPEHRPRDWNVDEISDAAAQTSPYKEMNPNAGMSLAPRYEGRPLPFKGHRNYGAVRAGTSQ